MATIIGSLEKLRSAAAGHVHLRTPSNGGGELSEQTPWGEGTVGEVIVTFGG